MGHNISRKIKVIIVRDDPYQKDTASYNRNMAIEKMVRSVFDCELVVLKSSTRKIQVRIINGLTKRFKLIVKLNKCFVGIDEKYDHVIFLRSIDPLTALITWLYSKPKGIKLAIERNEFPYVFLDEKANPLRKILFKHLILPWHYRLFDVLFLMTDELVDFYSRYARKKAVIQKLPMTVDFSRFEFEKPSSKNSYIFYAGSLLEKKDGVESLIHAFKNISEAYPNIDLKIAGATKDKKQEKRLKNMISEYKLQARVTLLGLVNRDEIPGLLCSAKILVLPRPDSMQARGGFPTKLGEYLAAEVPVIVTRVGEIPNHLSEDEVFFISPHKIIPELSEQIEYILLNYDQAKLVACKGKHAAMKHFSLEVNQHAIKSAFNKLIS